MRAPLRTSSTVSAYKAHPKSAISAKPAFRSRATPFAKQTGKDGEKAVQGRTQKRGLSSRTVAARREWLRYAACHTAISSWSYSRL